MKEEVLELVSEYRCPLCKSKMVNFTPSPHSKEYQYWKIKCDCDKYQLNGLYRFRANSHIIECEVLIINNCVIHQCFSKKNSPGHTYILSGQNTDDYTGNLFDLKNQTLEQIIKRVNVYSTFQ